VRFTPVIFVFLFFMSSNVYTKNAIQLTLDTAVDIAINNSYRTRELDLELQRSMHYLNAYKAGLHT